MQGLEATDRRGLERLQQHAGHLVRVSTVRCGERLNGGEQCRAHVGTLYRTASGALLHAFGRSGVDKGLREAGGGAGAPQGAHLWRLEDCRPLTRVECRRHTLDVWRDDEGRKVTAPLAVRRTDLEAVLRTRPRDTFARFHNPHNVG